MILSYALSHVLSSVLSCLVLSCPVLSCHVLSFHVHYPVPVLLTSSQDVKLTHIPCGLWCGAWLLSQRNIVCELLPSLCSAQRLWMSDATGLYVLLKSPMSCENRSVEVCETVSKGRDAGGSPLHPHCDFDTTK